MYVSSQLEAPANVGLLTTG